MPVSMQDISVTFSEVQALGASFSVLPFVHITKVQRGLVAIVIPVFLLQLTAGLCAVSMKGSQVGYKNLLHREILRVTFCSTYKAKAG